MSCAAAVAALALAEPARAAEPRGTEELAQSFFDEARGFMAAGDYARACPMFAESQRLDPGGGTLLNLAICHEKQGKIATAWSELNAALSLAQRDNRADRIEVAKARLAEIASHVPRVLVVVPEPSNVAGLTVKLDGVELARSAWGTPASVDPGQHAVEASAPGKKTFVTAVVVRADGATLEIAIPPLEA